MFRYNVTIEKIFLRAIKQRDNLIKINYGGSNCLKIQIMR